MHEVAQVAVERFGCEVDELVATLPESFQSRLSLLPVQRRVDLHRAESELMQRVDLILHQTDERRQDEHGPVQDARRQLERQRLTCTCRHDGNAVAASEYRIDDFALAGSEVLEAKSVSKDGERGGWGPIRGVERSGIGARRLNLDAGLAYGRMRSHAPPPAGAATSTATESVTSLDTPNTWPVPRAAPVTVSPASEIAPVTVRATVPSTGLA